MPSCERGGFATLYMNRLNALKKQYRGLEHEDEMVDRYPLCTFGNNPRAASIDTPLHAFLPFKHVDHLHPDWAIALAASANGKRKGNGVAMVQDNTISIRVNGEHRRVPAGISVADLALELGLEPTKVAVERNLEIVARSTLATVVVEDGDDFEIVTFVGGG